MFSFAGLFYLHTTSDCNATRFSQFKALDIWFAICFMYILLSFIESVVIISLEVLPKTNKEDSTFEYEMTGRDLKKYMVWIDKLLRFFYPIGFLSCAILFFMIFAHI